MNLDKEIEQLNEQLRLIARELHERKSSDSEEQYRFNFEYRKIVQAADLLEKVNETLNKK